MYIQKIAATVIFLSSMNLFSESAYAQLSEGEKAVALLTQFTVLPNLPYTTQSGKDLKLDVYLPPQLSSVAPGKAQPLTPVVINFHSGGWARGNKERGQLALLPFLQMGFAAVNIEYRLAKDALAPAAVEDSRCALRWVIRNAKQYGFDTNKIVLTGSSAGGHLALITGMLPVSAGLDRQCATSEEEGWDNAGQQKEMTVAAVVNWYGITDVPAMLRSPEERGYAVEWFGSMSNREQVAQSVSPMTHVRRGLPAVLTIHGDQDTVVPYAQAARLHTALEKAGVPNTLFTIPGGGHGGFSPEQQLSAYTVARRFLVEQRILAK